MKHLMNTFLTFSPGKNETFNEHINEHIAVFNEHIFDLFPWKK